MNNAPEPLEFLICDVSQLWRQLYNTVAFETDGILELDRRVLFYVKREPGLTQVELAERLLVDPQSLTRVLTRLEKKAWIEKRTPKTDRRVNQLFLTPQGQAIEHKIRALIDTLRPQIMGSFSKTSLQTLRETLETMTQQLKAQL